MNRIIIEWKNIYPYECPIIILFMDRNWVKSAVTSNAIASNWYASWCLGAELWPWPMRSTATILATAGTSNESNCDLQTSIDPPTPCIRNTVTPDAVLSSPRLRVTTFDIFALRLTMQTCKWRCGRSSVMSEWILQASSETACVCGRCWIIIEHHDQFVVTMLVTTTQCCIYCTESFLSAAKSTKLTL